MITITVPTGELLQTSVETFEAGDTGYVWHNGQLTKQTNGAPAFVVVAGAEYLIAGEAEPFPALVYRSALGELTTTPNGDAIDVVSTVFPPLPASKKSISRISDFGVPEGGLVDTVWQAFTKSAPILLIDVNCTFSVDLAVANAVQVLGEGTITAVSGSGADIVITADGVVWGVKVEGNEHKTAEITAISGNDITIDDPSGFNSGDQVIVKSDDSYQRVLWAGTVSGISGDVLTTTNNNIDGDIGDVSIGDTIRITQSDTLHGKVQIIGCKGVHVTRGFSGSSRDLEFQDVEEARHDNIELDGANLVYRFAYNCTFGNVVSKNSRFYGRTLQASRSCTLGDLFCDSPLFSGHVTKGAYECTFGNVTVKNAPIMSLQIVAYNGTLPSLTNPKLQDSLDNDDKCIYGDLYVENGNWVAAIKSIPHVRFGDVKSTGAYKSFYLDQAWGIADLKRVEIDNHNPDGGNVSNSSSTLLARNNLTAVLNIGEAVIKGAKTTGENGPFYLNALAEVNIGKVRFEGCEDSIRIGACGVVNIGELKSLDNINGFQVARFDGNGAVNIKRLDLRESVNSNLDRFIHFGGTSPNVLIEGGQISADSAMMTVTDGVRMDEFGDDVTVQNVSAEATNSATINNTVRNTSANNYVILSNIKAKAGVTNSVSASATVDFLSIVNCHGNVVDVTGPITHKNLSGNLE